MAETILVTGGAGFIGRHLVDNLLRRGHRVRLLDSFIEQVHGPMNGHAFRRDAEVVVGDVRDENALRKALKGVDKVAHLAAEVGVGQSMYAVDHYVGVNDLGTAKLLQALIDRPVQRIVVASSMSIYGEGLYAAPDGTIVENAERAPAPGEPATWHPRDAAGRMLRPLPTPEWKRPSLASVYALTKYVQERLTLTVAPAYGMEAVALRLFNVYGPGQALSNPYTGVLAIFASRLLNRQRPLVFEDGEQRRDFVHVDDVAEAFALALEDPSTPGQTLNIGSGRDRSVREIATLLARAMGVDIVPEIVGKARVGDIRHCFADIAKARDTIGFSPRDFGEGLAELAQWVSRQDADDHVDKARKELELRGLVA